MKLVILDIDNTLTKAGKADTDCYVKAINECFLIADMETDWSLYRHSTDSGILEELFHGHFNRTPSDAEVSLMQERFFAHLNETYQKDILSFSETEGASAFLTNLKTNEQWRHAIATGAWSGSAYFKLKAAKLPVDCPVVTSESGPARETILIKAIESSRSFYNVRDFSRIVSVGDGLWDVMTAKALRLPFVGIACGVNVDRLKRHGVSHVLPNFFDREAVFRALDEALEPTG